MARPIAGLNLYTVLMALLILSIYRDRTSCYGVMFIAHDTFLCDLSEGQIYKGEIATKILSASPLLIVRLSAIGCLNTQLGESVPKILRTLTDSDKPPKDNCYLLQI